MLAVGLTRCYPCRHEDAGGEGCVWKQSPALEFYLIVCSFFAGCFIEDEFICEHIKPNSYGIYGQPMRFDHLNRCYYLEQKEYLFCLGDKFAVDHAAIPAIGMISINGYTWCAEGGSYCKYEKLIAPNGSCYQITGKYDLFVNRPPIPPYLPPQLSPHGCGNGYILCDDLDEEKDKNSKKVHCPSLSQDECLASVHCEPIMGAKFKVERRCRSDSYQYFGCTNQGTCKKRLIISKENATTCWVFFENCVPADFALTSPLIVKDKKQSVDDALAPCNLDLFSNEEIATPPYWGTCDDTNCSSMTAEECMTAISCQFIQGDKFEVEQQCRYTYVFGCTKGGTCSENSIVVKENDTTCWLFRKNCVPARFSVSSSLLDENTEHDATALSHCIPLDFLKDDEERYPKDWPQCDYSNWNVYYEVTSDHGPP